MDINIEQLRISYNSDKIEFGLLNKAKEITIGLHKALRSDFETRSIGNQSKGSFTTFNLKNKNYSILSSAEAKNVKKHTAVMDLIIKSLKVD